MIQIKAAQRLTAYQDRDRLKTQRNLIKQDVDSASKTIEWGLAKGWSYKEALDHAKKLHPASSVVWAEIEKKYKHR